LDMTYKSCKLIYKSCRLSLKPLKLWDFLFGYIFAFGVGGVSQMTNLVSVEAGLENHSRIPLS
jgi:hypothetical protein